MPASLRACLISSTCSKSLVSTTHDTGTRATSAGPKLRSWATSFTPAPVRASTASRAASDPGRSASWRRHPAQPAVGGEAAVDDPADDRDVDVSPAQQQHDLLPRQPQRRRPVAAASGTAPAPSTTVFSSSSSLSTLEAIWPSSTSTRSSTTRRAISKQSRPTSATARPSASVGRASIRVTRPRRSDSCSVGALRGLDADDADRRVAAPSPRRPRRRSARRRRPARPPRRRPARLPGSPAPASPARR